MFLMSVKASDWSQFRVMVADRSPSVILAAPDGLLEEERVIATYTSLLLQ